MITGDLRSFAHETRDPLELCRRAAKIGSPEVRHYLAGVARPWAPRWALEYTLTRDASVLVPHATWSEDDPLRCLAKGTLSLDGRPWWEATRRAGLRWSVGVRWDALPHWEGWAPEHAPDHIWAPRKAVVALHGWLEGRVMIAELGRAREAADAAAHAASSAAEAYAAADAYAYAAAASTAAYSAAACTAEAACTAAAYSAEAHAYAYAATVSTAARDSLREAWTQYALGQGAHTPRSMR